MFQEKQCAAAQWMEEVSRWHASSISQKGDHGKAGAVLLHQRLTGTNDHDRCFQDHLPGPRAPSDLAPSPGSQIPDVHDGQCEYPRSPGLSDWCMAPEQTLDGGVRSSHQFGARHEITAVR